MGAPRSGTTYLQRVLDLHPDVCLTHETRVFAWLHAAIRSLPASDQFVVTERDRFVGHLRTMLPDVVRSFYRQLGPNARYWGDAADVPVRAVTVGMRPLLAAREIVLLDSGADKRAIARRANGR